jgi:hypothetical protein
MFETLGFRVSQSSHVHIWHIADMLWINWECCLSALTKKLQVTKNLYRRFGQSTRAAFFRDERPIAKVLSQ